MYVKMYFGNAIWTLQLVLVMHTVQITPLFGKLTTESNLSDRFVTVHGNCPQQQWNDMANANHTPVYSIISSGFR